MAGSLNWRQQARNMNTTVKSVHEPIEELLSAEDAFEDAKRLRAMLQQRRASKRAVTVHVPFSALLESLDNLESSELQQIAQRATERLGKLSKMTSHLPIASSS